MRKLAIWACVLLSGWFFLRLYNDINGYKSLVRYPAERGLLLSEALHSALYLLLSLCVLVCLFVFRRRTVADGASEGKVETDALTTPNVLRPIIIPTKLNDDANSVNDLVSAAEAGNAQAQFQLAALYDNGELIGQDKSKAFSWCKKAADQGLAEAQYWLGRKYLTGQGVTKNQQWAVDYFSKAATQGLQQAQDELLRLGA